MQTLFKYIATLGFIGYLPVAPGTFGSAAGFFLLLFLQPDDMHLLIGILSVLIVGTYAAHQAEKLLGKDSGHIVVDELCGYLMSALFIPKNIPYLLAAFFLFRLFDILKPPPVNHVERAVSGGAGVMLDDVLAGVYANICLQLWRYLA